MFSSCFFAGLVIFCWKPDMVDQGVGTEVIRLSVWDFMLTQLGARLYLMFAAAVVAEASVFVPYFPPLLSLGFPKNSLNRESLSWSYQLLSTVVTLEPFWSVVVRCWGETAFNNLIIKSQFLGGLESLDCHIQKCSLALFSALMWGRKANWSCLTALPSGQISLWQSSLPWGLSFVMENTQSIFWKRYFPTYLLTCSMWIFLQSPPWEPSGALEVKPTDAGRTPKTGLLECLTLNLIHSASSNSSITS